MGAVSGGGGGRVARASIVCSQTREWPGVPDVIGSVEEAPPVRGGDTAVWGSVLSAWAGRGAGTAVHKYSSSFPFQDKVGAYFLSREVGAGHATRWSH